MVKAKGSSIGDVIKQYRTLKGLTQEQLAELLNVSYQTVQKYEYGKSTPALETLILISEILKIPIDVFIKQDLREDLLVRIESDITKNHELVMIIKESPELREIIRFYSKSKSSLKDVNILEILRSISKLPQSKRDSYIEIVNRLLKI
jgi:transcriptional regulator with XRE-family HTH domain